MKTRSIMRFLFTAVLAIFAMQAFATDYFWVGGSGNWSDHNNHWATTSGGSTFHTQVPTETDDVYFDANSFSSTGQTVTLDADAFCLNMDWSTVTNNPTFSGSREIHVFGSMTLVSGMNYTATSEVYFDALTTGHGINTAGQTLDKVFFTGQNTANGGWTLQSDFVVNGRLDFYAGTFSSGGYDIDCESFYAWYSTTKNIDFTGSDEIKVGREWRLYPNGTATTFNAGTSTIVVDGDEALYYEQLNFVGGAYAYHNLVFNRETEEANTFYRTYGGTLEYNNTFNDVTFNIGSERQFTVYSTNTFASLTANFVSPSNALGTPRVTMNSSCTIGRLATVSTTDLTGEIRLNNSNTIDTLELAPGTQLALTPTTHTFNEIIANGTCERRITILTAHTGGSPATMSKASGTVNASWVTLDGIIATGGATFNATNSIGQGSTSGWNITTPTANTYYWVGGTGNWNNVSHWATSSGGTPSGCGIPTVLDNVVFDANSFSSAGQSVTVDVKASCNSMTWASVVNNPTLAGSQRLTIAGSLTLSPNMNMAYNGQFFFDSESSNTIDLAGITIESAYFRSNSNLNGDWTLLGEFDVRSQLEIHSGEFFSGGNIVSSAFFVSNSGYPRTLDFTGTPYIEVHENWNVNTYLATFTLDTAAIHMVSDPSNQFRSMTFFGGSETYNDLYLNHTGLYGYSCNFHGNNTFDDVDVNLNGVQSLRVYNNNTYNDFEVSHTGNYNTSQIPNIWFHGTNSFQRFETFNTSIYNPEMFFYASNSFSEFTPAPGSVVHLGSGQTQTIGTLNLVGSCDNGFDVRSTNAGSIATISVASGTVNAAYLRLQDNTATGGATFNATAAIDNGNVTGWNLTTKPATNYYWVGGTGNWSDPAHWSTSSGGAGGTCDIPSFQDNVFFDVNSFTNQYHTVTIDQNSECRSMTWNGVQGNPTMSGNSNGHMSIYGSLIFDDEVNTNSYSGNWYFESTQTGNILDTKNKYMNNVYFNGSDASSGEWTLQSDFRVQSSFYHYRGTINSNGYDMSAFYYWGNHSYVKTLNLVGSGTFNAKYYWQMPTNSNTTFNVGDYKIYMDYGVYAQFNGGNRVYNDLEILLNYTFYNGNPYISRIYDNNTFNNLIVNISSPQHLEIYGNNTFNDAQFNFTNNNSAANPEVKLFGSNVFNDFSSSSTGSYGPYFTFNQNNTFSSLTCAGVGTRLFMGAGTTQTTTNALALGSGGFPVFLQSTVTGSQANLSQASGQVCLDFVWLKDMNATGGASFNAGGSSSDLGNNTGWTFSSCAAYYWVGGTGNWSDTAHWATSSGGSVKHLAPPTATDNVFFDGNSFTATGQTVSLDVVSPECQDMSWLSSLYTPTLDGTAAGIDIHGSMNMIAAMNVTYAGDFNFKSNIAGMLLNSGGNILANVNFLGTGEWSLTNVLNVSGDINLQSGTLLTNDRNVNTMNFVVSTTTAKALHLSTSTITITDGAWDVQSTAGLTFTPATSLIVLESDNGTADFNGAGLTYNDATITTPTTMTSTMTGLNTFNTLRLEPGITLSLPIGNQTTTNLEAAGSCTKYVTVLSSTPGSAGGFSQSSGTVNGNFIDLTDNTASGGATFSANLSVDNGNVSGWNFTSFPALSITTSITDASCNAGNDGTAIVNLTGGTAPFVYAWSTTETTGSISGLIPGSYAVTVTDSNGCAAVDSFNISIPVAVSLSAVGTDESCSGAGDGSAALTTTGGTAPFVFSTTATTGLTSGTYTYFVTDSNGCSDTAFVTINGVGSCNSAPTAVCSNINVSAGSNCQAVVAGWQVDGGSTDPDNDVLTYAISPAGPFALGTHTVTLTVTDPEGLSDNCSATITVIDDTDPIVAVQDLTVQLDGSGNASITALQVNNGSTDNCGIGGLSVTPSSFDCSNVGTNSVTLTVTDVNGNSAMASATVTVEDMELPTVSTQDLTVYLDNNGSASITAAQIDNGSSDNCGIDSIYLSNNTFGCVTNNALEFDGVTNYVNVPHSSDFNITSEITVEAWVNTNDITKDQKIVGKCKDGIARNGFVMGLGYGFVTAEFYTTNGNAVQTATGVTNNTWTHVAMTWKTNGTKNIYINGVLAGTGAATANDLGVDVNDLHIGIAPYNLNEYRFDGKIDEIRIWDVQRTASEIAGSMNACLSGTEPGLVAYYQFDQTGSNVLLDKTANGNDGDLMNMDPSTDWVAGTPGVSCSANEVTLTVIDNSGNSSSATALVTALDTIVPSVITQDITVALDSNGQASITVAQIDNASSDNCSIDQLTLDQMDFDCSDEGINTVTLTAIDPSGNTSAASATVTVEDNIVPSALANDLTVYLDNAGTASITLAQVNNGSSDNCGIDSIYLSNYDFDCTNVGTNTVTLTVVDVNGNSNTAAANITVADTLQPNAIAQDIIVQLDNSGNASITAAQIDNGSSDNCAIASIAIDNASFDCTNVGTNTVTLTVTDVNGNASTATANVDVQDTVAPTATAQNLTVQLDSNGMASITDSQINNGSSDNCAIASVTIDNGSFDCSNVGINTVILTVTDVNGNASTATATVTVEDNEVPVAIVQDLTVYLDMAGSAMITTAQIDNGSNDNCAIDTLFLDDYAFDCSEIGANTVTLTAIDVNGNTSTATATVNVIDSISTAVMAQDITVQLDSNGMASITVGDINNGSADACGLDTLYLDVYDFDCANIGANTVTLTVIDNNGNLATATATVTVEDNVAPVATSCPANITTTNLPGSCFQMTSFQLPTFSDACGVATVTDSNDGNVFTYPISAGVYVGAFPVGTTNLTFTATDNNGNASTCNFTVTVEDNEAPYLYGCPDSITVTNAPGNCSQTVNWTPPTTSDNCPNWMLYTTHNPGTVFPVGTTVVTYDVMDPAGNSASCSFNVNVLDVELPAVSCQNVTVQLDANGVGTTTAASVDNGSTDNCGIATLELSQTDFDCSHVGTNSVTLTVTDVHGNVNTCNATVTVEDNIAPVAVAQNVTIQLDSAGMASVTAIQVNDSSSDACGIATMTISQTDFDCTETGNNTVTLTVTDVNGNVSTATADVIVEDNIAPTVMTQGVTVALDASGQASITTLDIDNGSFDNCSISTLSLNMTDFDCSHVGTNTVTLTATDASGNVTSANATVTVEDNILPTVLTQNITLYLDANGDASTTAGAIDNASFDNCGINTMTLDVSDFDCSNVGTNTVTLSVTDVNGNMNTATATVTIIDTVDPIAIAQDLTVDLDANGQASITAQDVNNGSNDACGIDSMYISNGDFDCSNVGANAVTLTVIDANGNSSSANAAITIEDNMPATVVVQNITVRLDSAGLASINVNDIDSGSFDNCGIDDMTLSVTDFDCSNTGLNTVTLTVTDVNGNVSSANAIVEVEDAIAPTAIAADLSISLDANGQATITTAQINNGSNDECGIANVSISQTDFDCSHVGTNSVTLTVEDNSGNVSTATSTVTISDDIAPTVVCTPVTINLSSYGVAQLTPAMVDGGTTDNCGIETLELSQTVFDCAQIGVQQVTLTATDVNGNVSTCMTSVTVVDTTLAVTLTCSDDITVSCANSLAPVSWDAPDAQANSDICGVDCNDGSEIDGFIYLGEFQGHHYYCSNTSDFSWIQANALAQSNGGNIVSINTPAENNFVKNAIQAQYVWIGYNDLQTEGNWMWSDGSANGYESWQPGEPNNQGSSWCWWANNANHAVLKKNTGKWYDRSNLEAYEFVMELECNNSNLSVNQIAGPASGSVFPVGVTPITYVAYDSASGLSDTCTFNVTVETDNEAPMVVCQNVTLTLMNGIATINPQDLDGGSSDNCSGISSLTISQSQFDSTDVGANEVTLTATDGAGNSASCQATVTIEAPAPQNEYCTAGGNSYYEWIENIQVNGQSNASGNDGGYGDYTNQTISLPISGQTPVSLTPGYSGSAYVEHWRIWIDLNNDGDFNDGGEKVFQKKGKYTRNGHFNIPNNVTPGTVTTMRIAMSWNGWPSTCGNCGYGEVEDYTVVLSGGATKASLFFEESEAENIDEQREVTLFPNPNNGQFNLRFDGSFAGETQVEVWTMDGKLVHTGQYVEVTNSDVISIDLTNSGAGMYFVKIKQAGYSETIRFNLL